MRIVLIFLFMMTFVLNPVGLCAQAEELVNIHDLDESIIVDLRYSTSNNFMQEVLYDDDRCFLRSRVAEKLVKAQVYLKNMGYGLKVFDCYRPVSVQEKMFERFPQPGYVANPKTGSNHNRGAAVDVGLVDEDGEQLPMPSEYDEFSERSHLNYEHADFSLEIENRSILQKAMIGAGFKPLRTEWWHFNDPKAKDYELMDTKISELP